jgi:hypothetical protein
VVKRRVGSFIAMKVPVCVIAVVESLCHAFFAPGGVHYGGCCRRFGGSVVSARGECFVGNVSN